MNKPQKFSELLGLIRLYLDVLDVSSAGFTTYPF